MSLQGGPVGCGLEDGGKGSRFALLPKSGGGGCFLLVPDSSELQAGARGAEGMSRKGVERTWGPLSPKPALWGPRAGRPPPPTAGPGGAVTQELDKPAQLRARPPPPSVPKLSPRLRRPGPSPHPLAPASGYLPESALLWG